MANMFSGNREKEVPKTFKDCYKTDSVSNELWHWCEQIEKWGLILFVIVIIVGLSFSIGTSIVEKEVIVEEATSWRDAETEIKTVFEFGNFLVSLLYTSISAVLEYIIYHIIALLIGALATIVQSTRITANVSLYKYATENDIPIEMNTETENKPLNNNSVPHKNSHVLRCEKCDNLISSYPCVHCGHQKESGLKKQIVVEKMVSKDSWICPECCRENINEIKVCKCGYKLNSNDITDNFTSCKSCDTDISSDEN